MRNYDISGYEDEDLVGWASGRNIGYVMYMAHFLFYIEYRSLELPCPGPWWSVNVLHTSVHTLRIVWFLTPPLAVPPVDQGPPTGVNH